jgi:hypothetical protein
MRFVFISKTGDTVPLAQRLEQEGTEVTFYVCENESSILDKHITDFGPDIVIIDSYGFGTFARRMRELGFGVIGGSPLTDLLAQDPDYGATVLRMCGLSIGRLNGTQAYEMVIEGWFNGKEFMNVVYNLDNIVFAGNRFDKVFMTGLSKATNALKKACYVGPVNVTSIISKDTLCHRELSSGLTAMTLLALLEGVKGRVTDVLSGMANGINRIYTLKPGWLAAVSLIINPNRVLNNARYDFVVGGLTSENMKHMWLYGIQNGGRYTGKGGRIAVVTARGETVKEARRRVYRTIKNISIPESLYVNRIGDAAAVQHAQLKSWGWIS